MNVYIPWRCAQSDWNKLGSLFTSDFTTCHKVYMGVAAAVLHAWPGSYWSPTIGTIPVPPLLQVDAVEGVLIYRFQAPLHFANVAVFKSRIQLASGVQLVKRRPSPRESDGFLPRLFRGVSQHCSAVSVALYCVEGCDGGSEQPCWLYFGVVSILLHDSWVLGIAMCLIYFLKYTFNTMGGNHRLLPIQSTDGPHGWKVQEQS